MLPNCKRLSKVTSHNMRLKTPTVRIGKIKIGLKHPIAIQSMTDTDTADAQATARQIIELAKVGSEMVRMTVNTNLAAEAVPEIKKILETEGYGDVPLIGDFHFNAHTLLTEYPRCAEILDKYRINPGNIGKGEKHDENFKKVIKIAIKNDKPIRIGINWGSLDEELLERMMEENAKLPNPATDKEVIRKALVESAMGSAKKAEEIGLPRNKIIIGIKVSELPELIKTNEVLAKRMEEENRVYALHVGLTEAGSGMKGVISSGAALGILLEKGIGDTIRISLTPAPGEPRTKEVEACKELLQSMGYRHFKPQVTSCPACGRADKEFFRKLTEDINKKITEKTPEWLKRNPKVAELKISVMGCVVNGPGEAKHADISISLPGKTEKPVAPVYIRGKFHKTLSGDNIAEEFIKIVEDSML